jgi:hypothetical protein
MATPTIEHLRSTSTPEKLKTFWGTSRRIAGEILRYSPVPVLLGYLTVNEITQGPETDVYADNAATWVGVGIGYGARRATTAINRRVDHPTAQRWIEGGLNVAAGVAGAYIGGKVQSENGALHGGMAALATSVVHEVVESTADFIADKR